MAPIQDGVEDQKQKTKSVSLFRRGILVFAPGIGFTPFFFFSFLERW